MNGGATGLQRWTKLFTVTSAATFLLYLVTIPGFDHRTGVLLCVFGFVCPMIFGMAYLLLPPYAGRTLVDYRLPGVHFVVTYLAVGLLVVGWRQELAGTLLSLGAAVWTVGIMIFVGSLIATVGPVLMQRPLEIIRGGDQPQRSSKLATATIPVAIAYLVVGTGALLAATDLLYVGTITVPQAIHFYTIGFGMLLIFALGVRLLIGFTHVTPPKPVVWVILGTGILTPVFLGTGLWLQPWFRIGGVLGGMAMTGYLLLVGYVVGRTNRVRPGLYGVVLGAVAGTAAVGAGLSLAFDTGSTALLELHRTAILTGFFPLTIVGYAYQFFPVTDARIPRIKVPYTVLTIGLLGVGVLVQGVGIVGRLPLAQSLGIGISVLGTAGYASLMIHRFLDS